MEEIKGCPFCDSEPTFEVSDHILVTNPPKFTYHIKCENEDCKIQPCSYVSWLKTEDAIAEWNNRRGAIND